MDPRPPIVSRIARALAGEDVVDGLARRLPPTDLQSLMLHVYRERSARRLPTELLAQYERTRLLRPSSVDSRALAEIERVALDCAAAFEALELSPVAPLGLNAILGQIDQNNCLATVRNAEVLADPTTLKALECARRRRAGFDGTIRLCARSRQVRLQPFDNPNFSPHFGLFSLVSAGRDRGTMVFESEALLEHLGFYLGLLQRLGTAGHHFQNVIVQISDTDRDDSRLEHAETGVLVPLRAAFPGVTLELDRTREQGRTYYSGLCLKLDATGSDGNRINLADGGFTDWTRRLLSNAKERLLVSGIGIELLTRCFRR